MTLLFIMGLLSAEALCVHKKKGVGEGENQQGWAPTAPDCESGNGFKGWEESWLAYEFKAVGLNGLSCRLFLVLNRHSGPIVCRGTRSP